jgi:glycosyltransferase involved in cell wall biosynthesis
MSSSIPSASIVVPCRNERHHIEACLRSILAQQSPQGGFEVIVADGMSDDGTREILAQLAASDARLRVIDNPGRTVSTGLNAAIEAAHGQVILRMDAHTTYAQDYVRRCLEVLYETGADNVGGPWVARGDAYMSRAIAAAFQSPFAAGGARAHHPGYEGPVDTVYLGCWPRQLFDWVGLFDEGLVRNQDDEFNLRLTRAGGSIWQSPSIRSWYRPRGSLTALVRQYLQYGYWKVRVIQKHKLPASPRHLIPACLVLLLFSLLVMAPWWSLAAWSLIGLLGMYTVSNLVASLVTAARQEWRLLPLLPLVFAGYHFAYGCGFLGGVWDFVVRRREPRRAFTELTRSSPSRSSQ